MDRLMGTRLTDLGSMTEEFTIEIILHSNRHIVGCEYNQGRVPPTFAQVCLSLKRMKYWVQSI